MMTREVALAPILLLPDGWVRCWLDLTRRELSGAVHWQLLDPSRGFWEANDHEAACCWNCGRTECHGDGRNRTPASVSARTITFPNFHRYFVCQQQTDAGRGSVGGDRTSDGMRPCVSCSGDIRCNRGLPQSALETTSRRVWLGESCAGEPNEFRRLLKLRHWVHTRWPIDNDQKEGGDAFAILEKAKAGAGFHCSHSLTVQLRRFGLDGLRRS